MARKRQPPKVKRPLTPCRRKACHASVRIIIGIAPSIKAAARLSGVGYTACENVYQAMGVKPPPQENAQVRIPESVIRKAWGDRSRSYKEAAAELGISGRSLYARAKKLGFPSRSSVHRRPLIEWSDDFDEMWEAGVWAKDIAAAAPKPPKSVTSVTIEARKRRLKPRLPGPQINGISLLQYLLKKDAANVRAATKALWFGAVA